MVPNLDRIKAFVFDVDGVLTDGMTICNFNDDGEAVRAFNEKDGFALRMACINGYGLGVITGGRSIAVQKRLNRFGFTDGDIYLHVSDKTAAFLDYCSKHGFSPDEVMYFGDDVPDIPVLMMAGVGVTPSDAMEEAKEAADMVADYPGGGLCVRSVVEKVLRQQNRWIFDVNGYDAKF